MIAVSKIPEQMLDEIKGRIEKANQKFGAPVGDVTLVAISKTFDVAAIEPLLMAGHRRFGENRVQEAQTKWPGLKNTYPDVELHLVGPLQTNKARDAVALFDVIQTVDREKLAKVLRAEMVRAEKDLPCFVQVNIGGEAQKAGIPVAEVEEFVAHCRGEHQLNIIGLMAIPPKDAAPGPYFAHLATLAKKVGVTQLSMGMSADFETAIEMGATHVRVGPALFGRRD
jgi:pyridoxal phosphate enzyme (YggS family)